MIYSKRAKAFQAKQIPCAIALVNPIICDHIMEYRNNLNVLKAENRTKLHSATLIYNQLKKQSPTHLKKLFTINNNTRAQSSKQTIWSNSVGNFKLHLKDWLRTLQINNN